jgi:hypothetical protein
MGGKVEDENAILLGHNQSSDEINGKDKDLLNQEKNNL